MSRFLGGFIRPPRKGLGHQANPVFLPVVSIPKTKPSPRQDLTIPDKKVTQFELPEGPSPVSILGPNGKNSGKKALPDHPSGGQVTLFLRTFNFSQAGARWIEFQALPGPEARALRAKTMRPASFLGRGGQAVLSLGIGLFRCRGAPVGAR